MTSDFWVGRQVCQNRTLYTKIGCIQQDKIGHGQVKKQAKKSDIIYGQPLMSVMTIALQLSSSFAMHCKALSQPCNSLQCSATICILCNALECSSIALQCSAISLQQLCNALQHFATLCNALHLSAMFYNALQRPKTLCNALHPLQCSAMLSNALHPVECCAMLSNSSAMLCHSPAILCILWHALHQLCNALKGTAML